MRKERFKQEPYNHISPLEKDADVKKD